MNREIKFGYWSHGTMRYITTPDGFKWFGGENGLERTLTSCKLMQYTGMNDKNGIEIYEGDIVKYGSQIGEVIWDKFCWNIKDFYESCYDCPSLAFSECLSCEVIGNIHANKELLT